VNGTDVATGGIPVTFSKLQLGVQYGVVVYWYGNNYIRYINDSNSGVDLQRYDLVTLNQSNPTDTLVAYFENVPSSQAASLNIIAEYPNGTRIGSAAVVNGYDLHSSGMWLTVSPPFQSSPYTGTFTGGSILPFIFFNHETYTVEMSGSSCGPEQNINGQPIGTVENVWSHWQDNGNTNEVRAVSLNGNQTIVAIYDQVQPANCAALSSSSTANTTSSSGVGPMIMSASLLTSIGITFGIRWIDRFKAERPWSLSGIAKVRSW
jgi:hypothetical protein